MGRVELDLGRRVGAIAELILEALKAERVDTSIRTKPRHQERGKTGFYLREHNKGIRHRRRQKPFVTGNFIMPVASPRFANNGAHIRAALTFRHAHAERDRPLLEPGLHRAIIVAGDKMRQPGRVDLW